jgi:hypothetical protein
VGIVLEGAAQFDGSVGLSCRFSKHGYAAPAVRDRGPASAIAATLVTIW